MEQISKLNNLVVKTSNIRGNITKPLNKHSLYMLMLPSLHDVITEINMFTNEPTKFNIFNTAGAYHPNKMNIYIDTKARDMLRSYFTEFSMSIKESCEDISIVKNKLEDYKGYNIFYSLHKLFETATKTDKKNKTEILYDLISQELKRIGPEYTEKYVLFNLDRFREYDNSDIKQDSGKENCLLLQFLYMLKFRLAFMQDMLKDFIVVFYSQTGIFKFDINQYEVDDIISLLIPIKRIYEEKKVNVNDQEESMKLKIANKMIDNLGEAEQLELADDILAVQSSDEELKMIIDKIKEHQQSNKRKLSVNEVRQLKKMSDITVTEEGKKVSKSILEYLRESPEVKYELKSTNIPIQSYSGMDTNRFINFNKDYEKKIKPYHILQIGRHFSNTDTPLYVTSIKKKDTSDIHNEVETYSFVFRDEDLNKSFTTTVDVPKIINGNRVKINGSEKSIDYQQFPHPIVKINEQVMITTNYNKMFIEKLYGKGSSPISNRYMRLFSKMSQDKEHKKFITFGSVQASNFAADKLTLSILELSSSVIRITDVENVIEKTVDQFNKDNIFITFSIKDMVKVFGQGIMDEVDTIPIGVYRGDLIKLDLKEDLISCDGVRGGEPISIFDMLLEIDSTMNLKLAENLEGISTLTKISGAYGKMLGSWVPIIHVLLYTEGLFTIMDHRKTRYRLLREDEMNKRFDKFKYMKIKFKDGALVIDITRSKEAILYYPLTTIDFSEYMIADLENKENMANVLVDFSGGKVNYPLYIMNFRNLLIDPITEDVLKRLDQPTTFMGVMLYAVDLLASSIKMNEFGLENSRIRCAEAIQGVLYKEIATAFEEYTAKKKRGSTRIDMSISKTAVTSAIMQLPNVGEYSELNPFQQVSKERGISSKGHVGKNESRAYTWKTRLFDESYFGVISMPSAYGASIGIVKQLAIDPLITDHMGFVKVTKDKEEMEKLKNSHIMSCSEGMTVGSVNRNDPPRDAMDLSQKNHIVSIAQPSINYTTNSFDRLLPHLATDFCKMATQAGEVVSMTDDYMTVKFTDGTKETYKFNYIAKNSAKGKYVRNDMITELTVGKKFKAGSPICWNPLYFKYSAFDDCLVGMTGVMANVFLITSSGDYEDAVIIRKGFAEKMKTKVVKRKAIKLSKYDKILSYAAPDEIVLSEDKLIVFNKNTEEDALLNNFLDSMDSVSVLSKNEVKAKVSGKITSIRVYYACEETELNTTIKKMVNDLKKYYMVKEKNLLVGASGENMRKYTEIPVRVSSGAKFNGEKVEKDEVLIEYYYTYYDHMSSGDKLSIFTALKGITCKIEDDDKMPVGSESGRVCDIMMSPYGPGARKVFGVYSEGGTNNIMEHLTELAKKLK